MTIHPIDCTCVICGAVHEQRALMSYSNFKRPDLDYRPSEMGRSTMSFWLQECPDCGLVAPSIEHERKISREFLDSEEYRTCRSRVFKSHLAEKFFKYYMISDKEGFADECMESALHAAWACDDVDDKENADYCRELVLPDAQWLIDYYDKKNGEADDRKNDTLLIRADVLRRLGRFEQLIEEYENVFFEGKDDRIKNQAIAFQLRKAREKDSGCYTFDDVESEDVRLNLEEVKERLLEIPPDFSVFSEFQLTAKQANELAAAYVEECWEESISVTDDVDYSYDGYLSWCNKEPVIAPNLHSTYLYEVLSFLLEYGMDPNYTRDGDWCLMEHVIHVVNGYIGADCLKLLLENGGNPNLVTDHDTVFSSIDHDVGFDANNQQDRRAYDSLVHCWMVLIGFGGRPTNGSTPLDTFSEWLPQGEVPFELEKLKNHKDYTFGVTHTVNRGNSPTIHIFDKRTYWEVAKL